MTRWTRVASATLAGGLLLFLAGSSRAADHAEAPGTRADPAADIADLYAWHDGDQLITLLTFNGLQPPVAGQALTFDEGVIYTIHIDNDGDNRPDHEIHTSFFTAPNGRRAVRVQDFPGAGGDVQGFVESTINVHGRPRVFAGLADDPFFFDLQGFQETLATGTLSFDGTRDSVAGLNASVIALRIPVGQVLGHGTTLNVWATTSR